MILNVIKDVSFAFFPREGERNEDGGGERRKVRKARRQISILCREITEGLFSRNAQSLAHFKSQKNPLPFCPGNIQLNEFVAICEQQVKRLFGARENYIIM